MQAILNPYINFQGRAREAMEFYHGIFNGELEIHTFGEFGIPDAPADSVMHAQLTVDGKLFLMGSDGMDGVPNGFALSLSGTDGEELRELYGKLSEGGEATKEISREAWGDEYGDLIDKFGIRWMFNIHASAS